MENIFQFMRGRRYDEVRVLLPRIGAGILQNDYNYVVLPGQNNQGNCSKSKNKVREGTVLSRLFD